MKRRNLLFFPGLIFLLLLVGMACNAVTGAPVEPTTAVVLQPTVSLQKPTLVPTVDNSANQPPANNGNDSPANNGNESPSNNGNDAPASGGWTTFIDKNKYYQIQVPSDWTYEQTSGEHYYIDQFKSPDEQALIENITYDDGTPFTGSQNGQFALQLLNKFYSNTGATGDIRVSDDSIMKDGSERLTWASKSGGYSGISYFELRGKNTFLMITIEWMNSSKDQYFDLLSSVVESYVVP